MNIKNYINGEFVNPVKGNYIDNSINGVAEVSYSDDYYYGEWSNNKYDGYDHYNS